MRSDHTLRRPPRKYLRLQASYRQCLPDSGSKHRQRVICSLGRLDLLKPHPTRPNELLTGQHPTDARPLKDGSMQAWDWRALLVLRTL